MGIKGLGETCVRQRNIGFLRQYGASCFRLIHMRSVRLPGYEERHPQKRPRAAVGSAGDKLCNSLSRSRSTVWELARCNPWEWFFTLTINGVWHDRYDLEETYRVLAKWLNNYNTRTDASIKYLIIPELHRDGAVHFHGLCFGLPEEHLTRFTQEDPIPRRLKDMLRSGHELYNWPAYAKKFGFVTLERIRDLGRCAAYMTKYITKDLQNSGIALNHHLYYCSKGLKRSELLYSGEMKRNLDHPDFSNDYVRIKCFSSAEEALPYFCDDMEVSYETGNSDSEGSCHAHADQPQRHVSADPGKQSAPHLYREAEGDTRRPALRMDQPQCDRRQQP